MTRKLSTPFANDSTQKNTVPVTATQAQTEAGLASYSGGFGSKNMLPVANGGQPPYGQDFNGVLNDITGNIVDINRGLSQYFDSDYATLIGGYPIGARLMLNNNSNYVLSIIAANSNDPNSDLTGWEIQNNVLSLNSLSQAVKYLNKTVYIIGDGYYVSDGITWNKDDTYELWDFKAQQPIQYYYNQTKDWNDAIELAQLNIFTKGYSPVMIIPYGEVLIKRPIWGGAALGMYMHEKHPELGIYNATTNTFSLTPDLIIHGGGRGVSTITFAGSKGTADPKDLTWVNYGAINTTPYKPLEQCSGKATTFFHANWLTRVNLKGFTIQGVNVEANGIRPPVHGITLFRGHRGFIDDVHVIGFTGAGLLCDGYYDSFFKEFEIFQCGRMSAVYGEYLDKGLTTLDYQSYAPLHIMNSDIGDGWDNCNFLRFLDFHIEDCFHAVADIIVSGKSAPIWIDKIHFECDDTEGTGKLGNKTVLAIGSYGVSRFSQDGVDGYVYGSEKFTGNGGGQVYWDGGSGYSWNYQDGLIVGQYSQLDITQSQQSLNVKIDGNNTPAKFHANNCSFGNITNFANAAQIVINDSTAGSYSQNYGLCPKMRNVYFNYGFDIGENISNLDNMIVLDNVSLDHATGTVSYGNINIVSRSATEGTTLYAYNGNVQIFDNYVINNLGK